MSKSLDGKTIRIKGTDVVTKVRYCSIDDNGEPRVVTEMSCVNDMDNEWPEARQFVTEDNPYADFFKLDQIEVQKPDGTFYTPNFRVAA